MRIFLVAAPGALFQEIIHHAALHNTLTAPRYKKLVRDVPYYVIATLMVITSGAIIALAYSDAQDRPGTFELLVLGAAAPSLFKNAVSATVKPKAHAGPESLPSEKAAQVRSYFRL